MLFFLQLTTFLFTRQYEYLVKMFLHFFLEVSGSYKLNTFSNASSSIFGISSVQPCVTIILSTFHDGFGMLNLTLRPSAP
jgi:hypothetical protein